MKSKKKIVLAYSGGLDTSIILKWLQENYDAEVICYTADIGQEIDRKKIIENAKKLGVKSIIIENLKALALIRKAKTEIYADFRQAMPHLDKSQFHDVKILDMIITRLGQAEECIWKILGHSLQNFCLGHPFSSEQYGQVFHCYSEYS